MTKYSVLICTYYGDNPKWLKVAIDSMLNQTLPPDEIVVVKDGKLTQYLDELLNDYKSKYPAMFVIYGLEENKWVFYARRIGVQICKNQFIASIDPDDYSLPDRIEKQMEVFNRNSEIDVVGCWVDEFSGTIDNVISHVRLPEYHDEIVKFAKRRCPIRQSALLYKKSAALNAGNYRDFKAEGYNYYEGEDYDLIVRMIMNGAKIYNVPEVFAYMRVDDDFYRRRGVIKLKGTYRLKLNFWKMGFFSISDFIISYSAHLIVFLIPNFLRRMVYVKLLRK